MDAETEGQLNLLREGLRIASEKADNAFAHSAAVDEKVESLRRELAIQHRVITELRRELALRVATTAPPIL